jgi:6,7-dimethyl-8-ribityllumazine synthase
MACRSLVNGRSKVRTGNNGKISDRRSSVLRPSERHLVDIITVPGALEIPGAISLAAESGRYDGYVGLGVVIRGETYHFEIVAGESARGIMALTMDGIAIGNGIITVESEAQALVRADPARKDKGGEAAKAALSLLELKARFG